MDEVEGFHGLKCDSSQVNQGTVRPPKDAAIAFSRRQIDELGEQDSNSAADNTDWIHFAMTHDTARGSAPRTSQASQHAYTPVHPATPRLTQRRGDSGVAASVS